MRGVALWLLVALALTAVFASASLSISESDEELADAAEAEFESALHDAELEQENVADAQADAQAEEEADAEMESESESGADAQAEEAAAADAATDAGSDVQSNDASAGAAADAESEATAGRRRSVIELGTSAVIDEWIYDWTQIVGRDLPVLVEFYLPMCGYCQGFEPEYERVARAFRGQPVVIARVDASRFSPLADQYKVKSVPDIRYFPAGSLTPRAYTRGRVGTDVVEYVNEVAGTKVSFDYSFRQKHASAASDVRGKFDARSQIETGTCPIPQSQIPSSSLYDFIDME